MKWPRIRLILALVAFLGWLGWLALAVIQKDGPERLSRAQLTEAKFLVVAEVVEAEDGTPSAKAKLVEVLQAPKDFRHKAGDELEVENLPKATPPSKRFAGGGQYLLPLTEQPGLKKFAVAGLPRSPAYGGNPNPERPNIYPWNDDTKAQLKTLGLLP